MQHAGKFPPQPVVIAWLQSWCCKAGLGNILQSCGKGFCPKSPTTRWRTLILCSVRSFCVFSENKALWLLDTTRSSCLANQFTDNLFGRRSTQTLHSARVACCWHKASSEVIKLLSETGVSKCKRKLWLQSRPRLLKLERVVTLVARTAGLISVVSLRVDLQAVCRAMIAQRVDTRPHVHTC